MKKGKGGRPRRTLAALAAGERVEEKTKRVVSAVQGLGMRLADLQEREPRNPIGRAYRQALAALADAPAFAQVQELWHEYLGKPVKPEEEKRELRNTFDDIREVLTHPGDHRLLAHVADNLGKSPAELSALLQHATVQAARHGAGGTTCVGSRRRPSPRWSS